MQILIKKIDGIVVPTRAHDDDAAYDITTIADPNIVGEKYELPAYNISAWRRIDYIEYRTGLFLQPQDDQWQDDNGFFKYDQWHTLIHPRSSICKKNLLLANSVAVIDHGYRGELGIRFKYVIQPEDLILMPELGQQRLFAVVNPLNIYQKGDKVAQIKATPNEEINFKLVEQLDETKRGGGGFGSSGK